MLRMLEMIHNWKIRGVQTTAGTGVWVPERRNASGVWMCTKIYTLEKKWIKEEANQTQT